jgi:hypothetical protein
MNQPFGWSCMYATEWAAFAARSVCNRLWFPRTVCSLRLPFRQSPKT